MKQSSMVLNVLLLMSWWAQKVSDFGTLFRIVDVKVVLFKGKLVKHYEIERVQSEVGRTETMLEVRVGESRVHLCRQRSPPQQRTCLGRCSGNER